jgi:hypothetical protein
VTPNPLQLAPWQTRDFKLLEKNRTLVRHQNPEDEAKDGTFAAAALTQNDEALLGPDFQ